MEIATLNKGNFELSTSIENDTVFLVRFANEYLISKESILTDFLFKLPKSSYAELVEHLNHYDNIAIIPNNVLVNLIDDYEEISELFPVMFMEFLDELNEETVPECIFLLF
jgi:hypothetical protein